MSVMPSGGDGGHFMSYVALTSLVLAIALPPLIAVLGGEEYAALPGIGLLVVALVLGIASWGTLVGRITVGGSVVLIFLLVVMGLLWAVQSQSPPERFPPHLERREGIIDLPEEE